MASQNDDVETIVVHAGAAPEVKAKKPKAPKKEAPTAADNEAWLREHASHPLIARLLTTNKIKATKSGVGVNSMAIKEWETICAAFGDAKPATNMKVLIGDKVVYENAL